MLLEMKISDIFLTVCIYLYTLIPTFGHKRSFDHTHGGGNGNGGNNGNGNGQVPEIDGSEISIIIAMVVIMYLLYKYDKHYSG